MPVLSGKTIRWPQKWTCHRQNNYLHICNVPLSCPSGHFPRDMSDKDIRFILWAKHAFVLFRLNHQLKVNVLTAWGQWQMGHIILAVITRSWRPIFMPWPGTRSNVKKHYTDVIMGTIASQITSLTIVYSSLYSGEIKENIKALRHWPLCGEFTGDRWIPRTNGQLCGKCFHLMTSSWNREIF